MGPLDDLVRFESANSGLAFRERAYCASERAALLRDLVALANAGVRGPRFLFLGVSDGVGRERSIPGITRHDWSHVKHLLAASIEAIEPRPKVGVRALEVDGALVGMLCLEECEDPPYLLGGDAGEGLAPGMGWVRRGTSVLPLLRRDLERLFESKARSAAAAVDVRVGFPAADRAAWAGSACAEALLDEVVLPVLPLDAVPSKLAAARLHAMLAAKASTRDVLGRTETKISRLAHVRLFGPEAVYEPHSDDSLRAQIADAAERYRAADAHYEYEVRAHPLRVLVSNRNGTVLSGATLVLTVPRIDGIGIAERPYAAPGSAAAGDGYPAIEAQPRTISIRGEIGAVPECSTVAAFPYAPRLWAREPAAGKTIPVDYTLHARELSEPLRDTLFIRIERKSSAGSAGGRAARRK